jgi:hypothetical protein
MKKRYAITGLVVCILILSMTIMYSYYVGYEYERQVGSYMDNARDCLTPECMLTQLTQAKQAMINEGLTGNDYGAIIFKKSSNSMKFQYQHLDAIIERTKSVQDWVDKSKEQANFESMKDVYNEKMDNLRTYINGETSESIVSSRSDWIAQDAWIIKNHFILSLLGTPICILGTIGACFFIVMLIFFRDYEEDERRYL